MKLKDLLFSSPKYTGPSIEQIAKEMKKINQERLPGAFANVLAEYEKAKKLNLK